MNELITGITWLLSGCAFKCYSRSESAESSKRIVLPPHVIMICHTAAWTRTGKLDALCLGLFLIWNHVSVPKCHLVFEWNPAIYKVSRISFWCWSAVCRDAVKRCLVNINLFTWYCFVLSLSFLFFLTKIKISALWHAFHVVYSTPKAAPQSHIKGLITVWHNHHTNCPLCTVTIVLLTAHVSWGWQSHRPTLLELKCGGKNNKTGCRSQAAFWEMISPRFVALPLLHVFCTPVGRDTRWHLKSLIPGTWMCLWWGGLLWLLEPTVELEKQQPWL